MDVEDGITVEALGERLEFDDVSELTGYVKGFLSNRVYDPIQIAAIRKLAVLTNGGAPEDVHRIARANTLHTSERDAEARRQDTPFADRIEELGDELEAREDEHETAREALFEQRDRIRALDRKRSREGVPRAERRELDAEIEREQRTLHQLAEAEQDANRAAVKARAAWNAARKAADRWLSDREARFVVGDADDRQVVNREGLLEWIERTT